MSVIRLDNSSATSPPKNCDIMYGNVSFVDCFPDAPITKVITGLKFAPERFLPTKIATAVAAPVANASPDTKYTNTINIVPKNSTKYLSII